MTSTSYKTPPSLSNSKTYDDWIKLIDIWKEFTTLEKSKQGQAIVLSLQGEAQDAVLELPASELASEDGVKKVIERLDKLYKKDELIERYSAIEAFDSYRRPKNTSIKDFLIEFEKRLYKTRTYKATMSDDILAYRLLKSANLEVAHEQLVKATVSDLKYEEVKLKLKKIFSDESKLLTDQSEKFEIKSEPTFYSNNRDTVETLVEDEDERSEGEITLYNRKINQRPPRHYSSKNHTGKAYIGQGHES